MSGLRWYMSWFSRRPPAGGASTLSNVISRKGTLVGKRNSAASDEPTTSPRSPRDKAGPVAHSNHNSHPHHHHAVLPRQSQVGPGGGRRPSREEGEACGGLLMGALRWLLLAFAGCLTALVVLLAFRSVQSALQSRGSAGSKLDFDVSNKQLLSFSVCSSMADQRLALVSGVVLASQLGRVVMLPDLLLDGSEGPDRGRTIPFSQLYDVEQFISALAVVGLEAVDPHRAFPKELYTPSYIPEVEDPVEELAAKHRATKHLHVECPLHRFPHMYFTGANHRIMWAVLDALQPSKELAKHIKVVTKRLTRATHHRAFNFLHLPMDAEWLKACSASINSTTTKNNCNSNVGDIDLVSGSNS